MTKTSGIYCIENTVSGMKYVGMAQDIQGRWRSHKCELRNNKHANSHLQNAWNKYGEKVFKFYILELAEKEELQKAEIRWIERLDTFRNGYNLTAGGDGQYKRVLTEEQKAHLSRINMGKKNPNYGLKRSAETRKLMSEAMKGRKKGPMPTKQREAISKGNRGKPKPWANKSVTCLDTGETYESVSAASAKTGISISGISANARGCRKSIHGLHFQFNYGG